MNTAFTVAFYAIIFTLVISSFIVGFAIGRKFRINKV